MADLVEKVRYEADISDISTKLALLEAKQGGLGDATGQTTGKINKHWASVGSGLKVAALGVAAGAGAIVAAGAIFGPMILSQGASLEALGVKSSTVFGGSLGDVQKWSSGVAKSMGITDKQAVAMAASMGDLLKPIGFTAAQAAAMSTEMIDLSGALSAWSGGTLTAAQASEVLTKTMLGERDGLIALGISISAAEVEYRLMEQGQKDLTGAARAQAEAIATQQLILEKSTDAQAAWTNGSMDGIKAQNASKAAISNLKETLVTGLYPALQGLLPHVTVAAEWLGERLPGAMAAAKEWTDENWPKIRDTIMSAVTAIRGGIEGFVTFVTEAWAKWGDDIMAVVNFVWPHIQTMISSTIEIIRGIIKTVTSLITGDWDGVWNGIKQIVSGVWTQIQSLVSTAADLLGMTVNLAIEGIKTAWSGSWDAVATKVDEVWETIKTGVSDGIDDVVGFVAGLPGSIKTAVGSGFDSIWTKFKDVLNKIIDAWNKLGFTLPTISGDWNGPLPGGEFTSGGQSFTVPKIDRLHSGGMVGGRSFSGLASDEVAAILRKGEAVLTPGQQQAAVAGPGQIVMNNPTFVVADNPRGFFDESLWRLAG